MSTSQRETTIEVQDIVCASCQTANPVKGRFCGRCGNRLWEPCNDCTTPNAMDQQYCGHCGTNLQQSHERRVLDIQTRLADCDRFCEDGRFLEAAARLHGVNDHGDSRLQSLVAQIDARLESLSQERAERTAQAAQDFAAAQRALDEHQYALAHQTLLSIPRGLRDERVTAALKLAAGAIAEIQTLTDQVKLSMRTQAFDDLLPHVTRLLEFRPHDEKLATLAQQLRQRQKQQENVTTLQRLSRAKSLLQAGQYSQAAGELAYVSEECLSDETLSAKQRHLYDLVMELDWLTRTLKQEPLLHPALLKVAQRWQKLRPNDADAKRIADQVVKRLSMKPRGALSAVPWAKGPDRAIVGCAVQWWRGITRVETDKSANAFHESPSRFLAALGLAMQGLGNAPLTTSLLPQRNQNPLMQSLSRLSKPSVPNVVWGCDLGGSGLKAIQLSKDKVTREMKIVASVFIPHGAPTAGVADEQGLVATCRDTMNRFVSDHVGEQSHVVLGFPGPRSLGRTFEIPNFKGKRAADAIAYEARMQIPIPADEIAYDWHAWPVLDEQATFQNVTLLAARRDHVNQVVATCEGLPVKILAVQSVCLALYNAALTEFFAADSEKPDPRKAPTADAAPIAVLDVGLDSSTLVIASPNYVRYRSVPLGTHRLDRQLMSRLHITSEQAQQLRHQPASARWMYQVDQVVQDVFGDITRDVSRTLRAYEAEGIRVDKLLVCGGGSEQLGLLRQLTYGNQPQPTTLLS